MKFFADTASLPEIEQSFLKGVNDGITTNPKIMETTGDLSKGFEHAARGILRAYSSVPVSLETDLGGLDLEQFRGADQKEIRNNLLRQAERINSWGENSVVKIPFCHGGVLATKELSRNGIKTNVTACMTPYQALLAAENGATYVSLFANRMLDSYILERSGNSIDKIIMDPKWKDLVSANKEKYFEESWEQVLRDISYVASKLEDSKTELIVGSIRSPQDIYRIVKARPQIITIPYGIVQKIDEFPELKKTPRSVPPGPVNNVEIMNHPMTVYSIVEFEAAAKTYLSKS